MAYKNVIPKKNYPIGDMKISFIGTSANIYFSHDFLNEMGWKHDEKVYVCIDDENNRNWLIQKSYNSEHSEQDYFKLLPIDGDKISKLEFQFYDYKISEYSKEDCKHQYHTCNTEHANYVSIQLLFKEKDVSTISVYTDK